MVTNKLIVFFLIWVLVSCNGKVDKKNLQSLLVQNMVEANGYQVPKDSMTLPEVTIIDKSKLKKVAVGNPKVLPINLNIKNVINPKVVKVGKARSISLGEDTFLLPKKLPSIKHSVLVKHPKSVLALPMRMKDLAALNMRYLDVDQGMNSSYIFSIIEDRRGNLWFGTWGGGVSRYDGQSFTHYTKKEGLSNNSVLSIIEDKKGNLWFGTYGGGIIKYDGQSFTRFFEDSDLDGVSVTSIFEDSKENLWFGTYGNGLIKYDGNFFIQFTEKEGLSNNTVRSIIEDKKGNLWFGTDGGGVNKFDGSTFTHYTEKEGLASNSVLSILEDKAGNLWFGTNGGGVIKYDGEYFINYAEKEGLSATVRTIIEDKNGNLWFGTDGGGVCKYNGNCIDDIINDTKLYQHNQYELKNNTTHLVKTFTHYTDKEGLSNNAIWSIVQDRSDNLWFGTWGGGVCRFDKHSFTHYTEDLGLSNNTVMSIIEDKKGNLWFGTDGGGVNMYNGKTITHYTDKEGLNSNYVWSILEDKKGNLWFGTDGGGVSKFDGHYFTYYTEENGLSNNTVWSIIEDKKGNLWFGTNGGGVVKYDGERFINYTEKQGLSNNVVNTILEDKNGDLWFGTDAGGGCRFNGESFTHFTEESGLNNNTVRSIKEDKQGNLWFGTDGGGLCKYDTKCFICYNEGIGLSNNTVWSIIEDHQNNLWISTEKGLNCLDFNKSAIIYPNKQDRDTMKLKPQIIELHKEDGLKAEDFFQNSVLLDSKNCIWWGAGKALSVLDLNVFRFNKNKPKIQLNNIYIQENFIDYRAFADSSNFNEQYPDVHFSGIEPFYNYPLNLELPYNVNHLTFHFSAIDWYAHHKIKYQYLLEGLDNNWSSLSPDNKADYRNIPYGKYIFKVKAIGSANKWSNIFEYEFIIHPPWWRTWWAYILYGILIIILMIAIVRWNGNRLRVRAEELKIRIDEATIEIKEQKSLIEEKHKEITDSINYAERIQRSLLASKQLLDENLNDYFIVYKPKDVVSGDFYWAALIDFESNKKFILCTADSTGHGVPGAIMSILNISCLEKAFEVEKLTTPDEILNYTRIKIIETLKKDGSVEGGKDGMDCSICIYDFANMKLQVAAANNPVWIIREGNVIEIKPDKMPVGRHDKQNVVFTLHEVSIQKGDVIYTLTDGFPDQFGGEKEKKFMTKNLRTLLSSNAHLPMYEQRYLLENTFANWIKGFEQVDDVTILGVKV